MYRFVFSTLKNFKSSVLKMFYYMITRVRARQKFADKKWRETCPAPPPPTPWLTTMFIQKDFFFFKPVHASIKTFILYILNQGCLIKNQDLSYPYFYVLFESFSDKYIHWLYMYNLTIKYHIIPKCHFDKNFEWFTSA